MDTVGFGSPPRLAVAVRLQNHRLIVTLSGVLDLATRNKLVSRVTGALTADVEVIRIDTRQLESCDSSGLSALLELYRAATAEGLYLYLADPHAVIRTVLETTGLAHLTEPPLSESSG